MSNHTITIETILKPLADSTRALPGWSLEVVTRDGNWELQIDVLFTDSYHKNRERRVIHCFLIPNASYDYRAWRWWLFQQCMLVQQHELSEFFRQEDASAPEPVSFKPFRPNHALGRNPYQVLEVGTEEDARATPGSTQMNEENRQ
jgi:hypothetical protein